MVSMARAFVAGAVRKTALTIPGFAPAHSTPPSERPKLAKDIGTLTQGPHGDGDVGPHGGFIAVIRGLRTSYLAYLGLPR
jgi:hypothetical protein